MLKPADLESDNIPQDAQTPLRLHRAVVWLVFLGAVAVTIWGWQQSSKLIEHQQLASFNRQVDILLRQLQGTIADYIAPLNGATGLFASSRSVEHHEWRQYASQLSLAEDLPATQAVGFIRRISKDELAEELAEMRFYAPSLTVPRSLEEREYVLVKYLYPEESLSNLIGLDISTDSSFLKDLNIARDRREAVLSLHQLGLKKQAEPGTTSIIALPIYANGVKKDTVEERRQALVGWVVNLVDLDKILQTSLGQLSANLSVQVYKGEEPTNESILFGNLGDSFSGPLTRREKINCGATQLSLAVSPTSSFFSSTASNEPLIILVLGGFVSLLLALVLRTIVNTEQRAIHLAEKMSAAYRESEERFRAMAESAPALLWTSDAELKWDYVNKAWRKFVGVDGESRSGGETIKWREYFHSKSLSEFDQAFSEAAKTQADVELELLLRRFDGVYRWMVMHATPRFLSDGTLAGYIGVCLDISARKQAEEELHRAREEAEDTGRIKTEFLDAISQKARTALQNILSLLAETGGGTTSTNKTNQALLSEEILNLDALVKDILEFVQVEGGALPVTNQYFQIKECLNGINHLIEREANKLGHKVLVHLDESIPDKLYGDPVRLRQILITLLANSIKFTPPGGGVVLLADLREISGKDVALEFTVADSGVGISSSRQQTVFDSFSQADSSGIHQMGGTGLGLNIVKRLVSEINGQITFYSKEGVGTAFHLQVPFNYDNSDAAKHLSE